MIVTTAILSALVLACMSVFFYRRSLFFQKKKYYSSLHESRTAAIVAGWRYYSRLRKNQLTSTDKQELLDDIMEMY
jgi:hypothetical protein